MVGCNRGRVSRSISFWDWSPFFVSGAQGLIQVCRLEDEAQSEQGMATNRLPAASQKLLDNFTIYLEIGAHRSPR